MSLRRFQAIILQAYNTQDTSAVVHTFSSEWGRLPIMAKGLRRQKGGASALLQPLALAELTVYLKDGAEMGTLREASTLDDRRYLHNDLERMALASIVAELASASAEIGQESPELFGALNECLNDLSPESELAPALVAAHGVLRILEFAGYEPHIGDSVLESGRGKKPKVFWLDLVRGRIHLEGLQPVVSPDWPIPPNKGTTEYPLPPGAVRFLYERSIGGEQTRQSHEVMTQLLEALMRLAEYHLDVTLKSVRFWRGIH